MFNRIALAAFSVLVSSSAFAADLPNPKKEPIFEAPAPTPTFVNRNLFRNIYVGARLEAEFGTRTRYSDLSYGSTYIVPQGIVGWHFDNDYKVEVFGGVAMTANGGTAGTSQIVPVTLCGCDGGKQVGKEFMKGSFSTTGYNIVGITGWSRGYHYAGFVFRGGIGGGVKFGQEAYGDVTANVDVFGKRVVTNQSLASAGLKFDAQPFVEARLSAELERVPGLTVEGFGRYNFDNKKSFDPFGSTNTRGFTAGVGVSYRLDFSGNGVIARY